MKNTITVIETTHNVTLEEWGDAGENHMRLLLAAGVTAVDPEAVPPGIMLEVLNPTPTSVTYRTKIDGIHCKIDPDRSLGENPFLALDRTPLETDWESFDELWMDMKKFGASHPKHTFLCADDPGFHYSPSRIPRLGWTAFLEVAPNSGQDEEPKCWTITIENFKKHNTLGVEGIFKTAVGRQKMLELIRTDAVQQSV
jgi:hypothetical protein